MFVEAIPFFLKLFNLNASREVKLLIEFEFN